MAPGRIFRFLENTKMAGQMELEESDGGNCYRRMRARPFQVGVGPGDDR